MALFSFKNKPKAESYEKLYRVKVEPVNKEEIQQNNTGEVIVKDKEKL